MLRRLLAIALLSPLFGGGCAMKRDIRDLQAEMGAMRASQERLLQEIQRQSAAVLDSLHVQDVRQRGDVASQLVRIERQLVQIQELTGQGQQQLAEFRAQLQAREESLRRAEAALLAQEAGEPADLLAAAESALERGLLSTARNGFQEFLRSFPQHPRAPAVRLLLAGVLRTEEQPQQALQEYNRILELHPDSPEAASALFRAAQIERQLGNNERARSMYNQLTAAYPGSPEAAEAREELRRMR